MYFYVINKISMTAVQTPDLCALWTTQLEALAVSASGSNYMTLCLYVHVTIMSMFSVF
jgi:hypothetical protein